MNDIAHMLSIDEEPDNYICCRIILHYGTMTQMSEYKQVIETIKEQ